MDINSSSSIRTLTCWPANQPLQLGQGPGGQKLILFSEDSSMVASHLISSVSTVTWWRATQPLRSESVLVASILSSLVRTVEL
jgi:hypothetical protein